MTRSETKNFDRVRRDDLPKSTRIESACEKSVVVGQTIEHIQVLMLEDHAQLLMPKGIFSMPDVEGLLGFGFR